MISIAAFRRSARALSKLSIEPDAMRTGLKGGVVMEWFLTTSTLKVEYCCCGSVVATYRTIDQPSEERELDIQSVCGMHAHTAQDYLQDHGLNEMTAEVEDVVNILLNLDSTAARRSTHIRNERRVE